MKLPKNPIWPIKPWCIFEGEGDGDGGGGETDHWAGDLAKNDAYKSITGRYKTQEDQFKGHIALEKRMGSMSSVPDDKSSDEDWDNFTTKMRGRNIDEYATEPPEGLPKDVHNPELETALDQKAHERGWPSRLYKQLKADFWEIMGAQNKLWDDKATEIKAGDEKTLRGKWLADYDKNVIMCEKAMEKTSTKVLLSSVGLDTHPVIREAFYILSEHLEEMKPAGGAGDTGKDKEKPWHGGYPEVKDS